MSETTPLRAWTVEGFRPGDEADILALFRAEFGRERTRAHWEWKFLHNPFGGPFISLAWHTPDRFLVGNQVLMPVPLCVRGEQVLAGHSLDLVVHHDFRRQGVFEHTAKHAFAHLVESGGRALVAFPNASSYPGFVRTLGWKRIVEPSYWTLRLSLARKLTAKVRIAPLARLLDLPIRMAAARALATRLAASRAATHAFTVEHGDVLPTGVDALWDRQRREETLSVWKDARYLDWRYVRHPEARFRFHALRRAGVLEGLAVSVIREGIGLVCELLVPGREVGLGQRLVRELCEDLRLRGAQEVHFLGADRGFFAAALADFAHRPAPGNVFVGRALTDEALTALMADASHWTLTYGDGDFV